MMLSFQKFQSLAKLCLLSCLFLQTSASDAIDFKKLKADIKKKQEAKSAAPVSVAPAVVSAALAPAPICNAQASVGVCYAFSGKKHIDDVNTAKANQAQKAEEAKKTGKALKNSYLGVNDMACRMLRGSFAESSQCPAPQIMGKCLLKKGTPEEFTLHYYRGGKFSEAAAQKDCGDAKSSIHIQAAGEWTKI